MARKKEVVTVNDGPEHAEIVLGLLESVEVDGSRTQRYHASEFGVALGLVNAYLNYCVKKGYVKVKQIPARRYFYYLTPKGFAEKSRLTVELVSKSLVSFRKARQVYSTIFQAISQQGLTRVVLVGRSELAEISMICAAESAIRIVAIVDPKAGRAKLGGIAIVPTFEETPEPFDGAVITELTEPQASYDEAVEDLGQDRVFAPAMLGITVKRQSKAAE